MTHMPDNTFAEKLREAVGQWAACSASAGRGRPIRNEAVRPCGAGIALNADCCVRYYQQSDELVGLGGVEVLRPF